MAFDYQQALKDGKSEDEILQHLVKTRSPNFKLDMALKDGKSKQQIIDYLANKQPSNVSEQLTKEEPQKKTLGGFASNLVSSGGKFFGGIAETALHPIQSAKGLANLVAGAEQSVLSPLLKKGVETLSGGKYSLDTSTPTDQQRVSNAVIEDYKNAYGGKSNIANTLYSDPFRVAGDAATVLGGIGGGLSKAGKLSELSKVSKLGEITSLAGEVANPVRALAETAGATTKLVSKTASLGKKILPTSPKVPEFLTNTPKEAFAFAYNPKTAPLLKGAMDAGENPAIKVELGKGIYKTAQTLKKASQVEYESLQSSILKDFADPIISKQPEIQKNIFDFLQSEKGGGIKIVKGKVSLKGSALEGDKLAQDKLQGIYNLLETTPDPKSLLNREKALGNMVSSIPRDQANLKRIATGILEKYKASIDSATMDETGLSATAELRSSYAKNIGPSSKIMKSMIRYDNNVPVFSQDRATSFVNSLISDKKFDSSDLVKQLDTIAGTNFNNEAKAIGYAKALSRLDPPTAGRVSDILKSFVIAKIPGASALVSPYFWGKIALNRGLSPTVASGISRVAADGIVKTIGTLIYKNAGKLTPASQALMPLQSRKLQ